MATYYGTNMSSILESPPSDGTKLNAALVNPKVRCFIETVTLQATMVADENIYIARIPANSRFIKTEVISSVSLSTSQLLITDGTTVFGVQKAYGTTADATVTYSDGALVGTEVTTETDLYATIKTTTLPSSGTVTFITYFADLN